MRDWLHLIVEGPATTTHSFVAGVLTDRGSNVTPRWGHALGLEPHTLAERVKTALRGDRHEELLLPADAGEIVATAIVAGGDAVGIRLAGRRAVRGAAFDWSVDAPSREAKAHARIRLVESLPVGVSCTALQEREEIDPDADEGALYTPTHPYEYHASGRISGTLPSVLDVYADAREMDFVRVSPLSLDFIPE